MIGKVSGRIDYVAEDHVLIEAAGVGYEVHCSTRTLTALPGPGEVAALYTSMLVREDLMQLFGFRTREEREWHRLLTSVQGVGAKVGLAILGALGPEGAGRAITLGDAAAVKAAPGVGPKLAQRIVNELKGKAPALMALGGASAEAAEAGEVIEAPSPAPKKTKAPKEDGAAKARAAARADAM
ncbi:MAG: Holliday junction branch migration protein RuvA, partial [Pseudomonadota bacterium]